MIRVFFFPFLLFAASLFSLERLSFAPNSLKTFVLTANLQMAQKLFDTHYSWEGNQKVVFDATLFGEQSDLPITKPPFILKVYCHSFEGSFKTGGKEKKISSKDLKKHPILAHIHDGMLKPFEFKYEQNRFFIPRKEKSKLPLAQIFLPEDVLNDLFEPIFGLINRPIVEGEWIFKEFPKKELISTSPLQLTSITYKIQKISNDEIRATFSGTIAEKKITLEKKLFDGKKASLIFKGSMEGIISWSRKNALDASYTAHYFTSGNLNLEELLNFPIHMEAHIELAPK